MKLFSPGCPAVIQDSKIKFGVIRSFRIHVSFFSFLNKIFFFLNNEFFIYNEVIIQLTLKNYNSEEHLVLIPSHRHQSMKRNSNQRLWKLEVLFSTIISNGNSYNSMKIKEKDVAKYISANKYLIN